MIKSDQQFCGSFSLSSVSWLRLGIWSEIISSGSILISDAAHLPHAACAEDTYSQLNQNAILYSLISDHPARCVRGEPCAIVFK